jgi:hypothetical protein
MVAEDVRSGQHRNDAGASRPEWFTTAYFHRPEELLDEALDGGLTAVRLFAVEGPAWMVEDIDEIDTQLESARVIETEPALLAATPHILAAAHRPVA